MVYKIINHLYRHIRQAAGKSNMTFLRKLFYPYSVKCLVKVQIWEMFAALVRYILVLVDKVGGQAPETGGNGVELNLLHPLTQ